MKGTAEAGTTVPPEAPRWAAPERAPEADADDGRFVPSVGQLGQPATADQTDRPVQAAEPTPKPAAQAPRAEEPAPQTSEETRKQTPEPAEERAPEHKPAEEEQQGGFFKRLFGRRR